MSTTAAGPLVLVAEDHQVNQKVANLLLTSMGLRTYLAADGQLAVEAYKKERPTAVLMDIMMPVMDGFHASKEIRRIEFATGRHTPIIACTALDESEVKEECISAGIDDYIGKPYSKELLANKMEMWLGIKLDTKPLSPMAQAFATANQYPIEPIDRQYLRLLYGLEQLDDVLALFLTVTETLLSHLDSAIESQDVMEVRRLAHEIKGGSYAVNAQELAKICLELEAAADNWPEVVKTYPALVLAFAKVREFMQAKQLGGEQSVGIVPSDLGRGHK